MTSSVSIGGAGLVGSSFGSRISSTETPKIRAALPRFVFAPLQEGQSLGTLTLTAPDGTQESVPLVCAGAVPADKAMPLSFPERLARFWRLAGRALFSFNLQI